MSAKRETQSLKNAYTDAPELHPNLFLGSLQLLFWLFFHPSAWRNHVARIDSKLRPNFCLAELSWAQLGDPILRRLLIRGYVVLPLLVALLVGLVLRLLSQSVENAAFGVTLGVIGFLAFGISGALVFGVAMAMAGGIALGLVAGVAFGIVGASATVVAGPALAIAPDGVGIDIARATAAVGMASGVAFGTTFGVTGAVAGGVVGHETDYPLARQLGGVFIGPLIGIVIYGAAVAVAGGVTVSTDFKVTVSLAVTLAVSLAVGWRTGKWGRGVALGVAFGMVLVAANTLAFVSVGHITYSFAGGAAYCVTYSAFFALAYVLVERMAGPWAGAVAGGLASGGVFVVYWAALGEFLLWLILPLSLVCILLGLSLTWWRPLVLYPVMAAWSTLLYYSDQRRDRDRPSLLRWNSAFWDGYQRLPLFGLDDHLVLVMERNPAEGQVAIEYLATSRQRWAAQAAQIELDARRLEGCEDVAAIGEAHRGSAAGELVGPVSALLRSLSRISQDVDAALGQESAYNQRLALSAVEDRLDGLLRELTRSSERYAVRFRPVARHWRQVVADHVRQLAEAVEQRQEIDSPYVIAVPLTEQQEIFVGRADASARIESLLLDRRRPPLLLYGQRRMGKTSLLNNLGRLLPSTIVPLFIDLQGPASRASDHAGLLYNLARAMTESAVRERDLALPPLSRETLSADPFTFFDEWLDEVEKAFGGDLALLAFDEFEALDLAFARGRFEEEEVLGMLRHLIQHRPRFKVLLTGSHTLDEVQRWSSYLINVQVVHISYLKEAEARQLIERPVRDFALRYEPAASQRVLDLTRGHPALVQLLCAEIVALKNGHDPATRRLACLGDVEAAVPEALNHGSFFFADIERNQVDAAGLTILRYMAVQGEGTVVRREALARQLPEPDELDHTLGLLSRRELIESADGGHCFQVEMIRRWFARKPG